MTKTAEKKRLGRPPIHPEGTQDAKLVVSIRKEHLAPIREDAAELGISLSTYFRVAALEKLRAKKPGKK